MEDINDMYIVCLIYYNMPAYLKRKRDGGSWSSSKRSKTMNVYKRNVPNSYRTGGFWRPGTKSSAELKTVDVANFTGVADTTGLATLLNGVATGTDYTNRIGRKTTMKTLVIKGRVNAFDALCNDNLARLLVVYDKQSNNSAPVITDVLTASTSIANINLNNRDRFSILVDKVFYTGSQQNTATQSFSGSPSGHAINIYKRLNLECLFSGVDATAASIQTGSIYLFTIGDQTAGNGSSFSLCTRIRFQDS